NRRAQPTYRLRLQWGAPKQSLRNGCPTSRGENPSAPDTLDGRASLALKAPALFRQQCWIDGRWQDADGAGKHEVKNPATGSTIGTVPVMGATEKIGRAHV